MTNVSTTPTRPPHPIRRALSRTILPLASAALVAACSAIGPSSGTGPSSSPAADFPLTMDNYGITIRLDAPPQRVVATSLPGLETAIAVGATDRIVGTAGVVNALLPEYQEQAKRIPVISKGGFPPPTKEAVLGVNPDFVVAGYDFDFTKDALGDRKKLAADGLQSYLSEGACRPATIASATTDVLNYGKIFGQTERAQQLVAQMNKQIQDAPKASVSPKVLIISDDPAKPIAMGAESMGAAMVNQIGGVYVPEKQEYGQISWEKIVDLKPDVIIVLATAARPADKTVDWIKNYGPASKIPAVANDRFLTLPINDMMPGVRTGQAYAKIANALAKS